jgi:hypothetical protein
MSKITQPMTVTSRKTTTRKSRCFCALHRHDRMLMSSCHSAFEHRHHHAFVCLKIFSKNIFCFLNTPPLFQIQNPGLRIILFRLPMDFKSPVLNNKIFSLFLGDSRTGPIRPSWPSPVQKPVFPKPIPSTICTLPLDLINQTSPKSGPKTNMCPTLPVPQRPGPVPLLPC